LALAFASPAVAATPAGGTLAPDGSGQGSLSWTGTTQPLAASAKSTDACFDPNTKTPSSTSGCDFFNLDVNVPAGFYTGYIGGVQIDVTDFGPADLDLGIYLRNADGTRGARVGGSGNAPGQPERALINHGGGSYYVVVVPYTAPPGQSYNAKASFNRKLGNPTLEQLNSNQSLLGPTNFRASQDQYISHSEPTIAMDPLNHDHLIAGSKMYESLPKYFFKIGTYESFDGGRTWTDQGHLPGYCEQGGQPHPAYCDVNNDAEYRVVSDITMAFDDEGNAYANVLDAPGGAGNPGGWNMQLHVKRHGQPWTKAILVHDNRNNPLSQKVLLDDKNWIAVDNNTTVDGAPNRPHDGKVGTMYVCWSQDESAVGVGQQIVVMRSTDGGATWGGHVAGDNAPYAVSQRGVISGIGCHIAIGPKGEVYATWYDNLADVIWQAKSIDRGQTFTPARPIAQITGVNQAFDGQAFRNLSIPSTGVDRTGAVYIVTTSQDGAGSPVGPAGQLRKPRVDEPPAQREAAGAEPTGADVILFKSTDGGNTYGNPVKVNQDKGKADQFQPWLAISPAGQLNVSYFDRRNDPNNYFIQTWLSRSNDGGAKFTDVPVGHLFWDPSVNPPISSSGEFIGDYQGVVADDRVAIPFWNDTQANSLTGTDRSPWQEVWSARIGDTPALGGPAPIPGGGPACVADNLRPRTTVTRTRRVKVRGRGGRRVARVRRAYSMSRRRVSVAGLSRDLDCRLALNARERRNRGRVKRIEVSIARTIGRRCRFVLAGGRLGGPRSCARPVYAFRARVTFDARRHLNRWLLRKRFARLLPRGSYRLQARATDLSGNRESPGAAATLRLRLR
jgi:hypothetical protein